MKVPAGRPGRRLPEGQSTSHVMGLPDGRLLSFATIGDPGGEPVIFCHSIPGSRLFPEHAATLAEELGLRVIVPERPGFGLSDFQPGRTIRDVTHDIGLLADALELDRFRVLGASSGCAYVLACCAEFPQRIERATIMAGITPDDYAGPLHSALPAPARYVLQRAMWASVMLHRLLVFGMVRDPDRAVQALARQLGPADQHVLERPDAARFIVGTTLEGSRRGVHGLAYDASLLNRPWEIPLESIPASLPLSFWCGDNDLATPLAHGRALAGRVPHATVRVLENCGHFGVFFDHLREILLELIG
ncbi:MAG TPA: alpha/beta fold hydrolase [Solirubrobacteraceae bacterium]